MADKRYTFRGKAVPLFRIGGTPVAEYSDGHPCRSVLQASQNQASTLYCRKETSCSSPELVVRECGLMLDEMISVLLLDCRALNVFCRIRSALRAPWEPERGESGKSVYRDSLIPLCQSCIPAGIFAIYKADKKIESFHGELPDFPLHTFILHKHPLLTTSHLKTYQSMGKRRALQRYQVINIIMKLSLEFCPSCSHKVHFFYLYSRRM